MFERDLEEDIRGETSGTLERFLVSMCNAGRDDSRGWYDFDEEMAKEDAQKIYDVCIIAFLMADVYACVTP